MRKLTLKNILAYSIDNGGFFSSCFGERVNIIHGRNTSGKSTLIQSILYTMGVNDSKENLNEILSQNVIFRLECELEDNGIISKVVFARSDDTLIIRIADNPPLRFDGINGNTSFEYARYKEVFNNLFNFKLMLQKQNDFTNAPIEAAFLPYYISQSVGWVYLRESVGDYRFYKDFKFDYLDYYVGIKNGVDRLQKYTLQKEKNQLEYELNQLKKYKSNDKSIKLSEKMEKRFKGETLDYLKTYDILATTLAADEAEHGKLCNKLSMLRGRQKVLLQTIRNLKLQKPRVDRCPVCEQTLPGDIRDLYIYTQDVNDALKEKDRVSVEIKKTTSSLNSVEKTITRNNKIINHEYETLKQIRNEEVNFDTWMNHHANIILIEEIEKNITDYSNKISILQGSIDELGSDQEINTSRYNVEKEFLKIFEKKANYLDVKIPENEKYKDLYSIISFPYQGVELHKIVMAYHFSFYELIHKRANNHKFPFLLDAILKEDIDSESRDLIFKFISNEAINQEQILLTIAEFKKEKNPLEGDVLFNVDEINKKYFHGMAKQICIGNAKLVRSFLFKRDLNDVEKKLLDDAFLLLQTV
ncbi:hypothetical protein ACCW94_20960 [Enterobacter soli]|uniref:hypothetical protein n=1 Tax=Enterobacteriaceae TaxID=543 RepID=UPI0010CA103A|nr:hypothetical protein [Citrobacter sp. wls711]TKU66907.1 hypothetical protein FDW98_00205 [Citrobacter sp. wls711]HEE0121645.1 hypothetical protein [Citrobacter gillenii]HEE0121888.1 hypothetical protein [Citrobacter gillenii]